MTWLLPTDICLVTGGSNGLGREILREFARKGCQTVSLDIDGTDPDELESQILKDEKEEKTTVSLNPGTTTTSKLSTEATGTDDTTEKPVTLSEVDIGSAKSTTAPAVTEPANSTEINAAELQSTGETKASVTTSDSPPAAAPESTETTVSVSDSPSADDKPSQIPEIEAENLDITLSIRCDVRSTSDLLRARDLILKKFGRSPTVIVLNAATRPPWSSIAESSFDDLQKTIDVNLCGALRTMRAFLPDTIAQERGFFVTVASALGIVVPKGLGPYGASKAALIGINEGLHQELMPYPDIHALLVCCGQLDSHMFADVETPSDFLAPVVSTAQLAAKIVKRVTKSKTATVYSPQYVRYLPMINSLPVSFARFLRRVSGVDSAYDKAKAKEEEARREAEAAENVDTSSSKSSSTLPKITYADLMPSSDLTAPATSQELPMSSGLCSPASSANSLSSCSVGCKNAPSISSVHSGSNSISSVESCDQVSTKPLVSTTTRTPSSTNISTEY